VHLVSRATFSAYTVTVVNFFTLFKGYYYQSESFSLSLLTVKPPETRRMKKYYRSVGRALIGQVGEKHNILNKALFNIFTYQCCVCLLYLL
jgi:hypothetical protein